MPVWTVFAHTDLAEAAVRQMESSLTGSGVEKVAAKFAEVMLSQSEGAFSRQADPRTGQAWAPPSPFSHITRSLLHKTGAMQEALRGGFALVPIGARAFVNVEATQIRKAMIHMYGVTAKARRSYIRSATGKREYKNRKNVNQTLPARRFVGVSPQAFQEMIEYAQKNMLGATNA